MTCYARPQQSISRATQLGLPTSIPLYAILSKYLHRDNAYEKKNKNMCFVNEGFNTRNISDLKYGF